MENEHDSIITEVKKVNHLRKYVIVIVSTILLIITNQIIIQTSLAFKKQDAEQINKAGKQRMLSQKLWAEVAYSKLENIENNSVVDKIFDQWKKAHTELQANFIKIEQKNTRINTVFNPLKKMDKHLDYAENIVKNKDYSNLMAFKQNQEAYLIDMDNYVKELEEESNKKLRVIQIIEIILAIITIAVIIIEVIFIFKPLYQELKMKNTILDSNLKVFNTIIKNKLIEVRENAKIIIGYMGALEKILKEDNPKEKLFVKHVKSFATDIDEQAKYAKELGEEINEDVEKTT